MIDIGHLKNNLDQHRKKLESKGYAANLDDIISKYESKNDLQVKLDDLKNSKNILSKEIGTLAQKGESIDEMKKRSDSLSSEIELLQNDFDVLKKELEEELLSIPNIPDEDVPVGEDESSNLELEKIIYKQVESGPDHVEIGEHLGLLDFESANKLSGSRFVVLKGKLAHLQRALIKFMLDEAESNGYEEYYVPFIVNSESLIGTGQLPKFGDDQFSVGEGKYLIPTAEVPLTNLYRNELIEAENLPLKLTAHTPCFRAEAGSYGKDTRGMIRQHQFEKIELVQITHPNESMKCLENLLNNACEILDKLCLPYRIIELCTGDLGFSSSKTFDIEVWMPSQNKFREISSCSNFTDFQARRANIKYKSKDGNNFVHTINGSGLAVGRCLIALIENNYDGKDSIKIPDCLIDYFGSSTINVN